MREVSLFSGAGGGLLGSMLLGWEAIAYVEFDDYCQRVIAARIRDGYLPDAPIFGDIRAFIGEGYAASYQGVADVITAGFPCQPFSAAGKRAGADDPRNMWPATIECIRVVRPRFCLLENVPGLLSSGYFGTILGDLAACGYDARWRVLSAAELGAPHKRDRLWIVGYAASATHWNGHNSGSRCWSETALLGEPSCRVGCVADANAPGLSDRRQGARDSEQGRGAAIDRCGSTWWAVEPPLGRVANGVADRVDQLRAIGNGQVSPVVAAAWRLLTEGCR